MAEIAELKVKRGRIKGSLTKLKTFADNIPTERTTIEEIQSRLDVLEKLFADFTLVDDKLVSHEVISEFSDIEDKYFAIKPTLVKELNALKNLQASQNLAIDDLNSTMTRFIDEQRTLFGAVANQPSPHEKSSLEIRLPTIHIQPFSGEYKEWPSFKDLFLSSVDKREGLSDTHKLQYLKGLLRGEAACLIKHISVTEANYSEAWSKLTARYDKKRYILNDYIKTFINQATVSQSSSAQLRKLTDTSDEIIRGIAALGQEAEGRDPWLVHIILTKTDSETRKTWAETNAINDLATLQELLDFLSKRCDALETVEPSAKKAPVTHKPTLRTLHSDVSVKCPECSEQHPVFKCPRFKALDVQARRSLVAKLNLCFNCLSTGHRAQKCKSKFSCHFCRQQHHSSLHLNEVMHNNRVTSHVSPSELTHNSNPTSSTLNPHTPAFTHTDPSTSTPQAIGDSQIHSLTSFKRHRSLLSILPTALVNVMDSTGNLKPCRMLIDSGSQASFITEDCAQRLGLKSKRVKIPVQGLGSVKSGLTKGKLTLSISSRFSQSQQIKVQAYILSSLTSPQPSTSFNIAHLSYVKNYQVADPHFNKPGKIDILLGAEYFIEILKPGQYIASPDRPALQNTIFGYIIAGCLNQTTGSVPLISCHADMTDIDTTLRRFWEVEDIPHQGSLLTIEEAACEEHFNKTHYIDPATGRYTVRLPFKADSEALGDSLDMAVRRFQALERKFKLNPTLHKEYSNFIHEYRELSHLEPVPLNLLHSNEEHAYLPHHAIIKPDSVTTRLRVVFDGSAATSSGTSLNQKLMVGPKTQRDLVQILISFRTFRIAITADIEKMYRMVLVDKKDRNFQRILWREGTLHPFQHLWLNTVTYGTSSAPFLATRCLTQLTVDFKDQFPLAEQAIKENFYVDDLMAGADNIKQAIQLQSELSSLLHLKGFHLRKWASNSQEFLDCKAPEDCSISSLQIDEHPGTIKVLGLRWIPSEDAFTFAVNVPQRSLSPTTKRTILSESSRIFDPLGFLAPITVLCKILLQRLWLNNYTWDNPISEELEAKWNDIRNNIHHIARLRIPRWLSTSSTNYELHGFSDASESAYAAVVYCRSISISGEVKTILFAAKTKVAPIKQISIPRLELCGALLLAQLFQAIKIAIGQPDISCYSWTDSMVVLSWLSSHPRKWKSYVGNRTSEILSILPRTYWHYVPSKENPADIASRGLLPHHLGGTQLWWYGPQWLQEDWRQRISAGSDSTPIKSDVDMEIRTNYIDVYHTSLNNDTISELFQQKSCLRSILRILGRCIRFYRNCRTKINKASTPWITTEELRIAMQACIRWSQEASFQEEINALRRNKHLPSSSKLHSLTPFLDPDHILRVGGRLDNSRCSYDTKHPIILPRDHTFVELLIRNAHEKYFHIGTTLLLSLLRQRYWIISGRSAVKRCIHHCITCTRHRALTSQQLMAQLPAQRVSGVRAFENVGVDYAGPIILLLHRGRGAKSTKGYISLFVCLSTKALHLEIVSDLSSEAFISCLKRFIARRGLPSNIYSDNGTNFVGANRRLCEIYKLVTSNTHNVLIADYLSTNNVNWHFIPPSAPHFGGIWESGIKSVKGLLKKTIGEARLTFEELLTLVAEIEGVLNSRPLGPISDDIGNINALTPAHFLIGQPTTSLPEPSLEHIKMSNLTRWRLVQKIVQDFWKRWHVHYLTSLQQRPKWRRVETNLQVGDLVIIREDNVQPSAWVLARIEKTHPGKDQLVRVATVRTAKGTIKRPVAKLTKLPVS